MPKDKREYRDSMTEEWFRTLSKEEQLLAIEAAMDRIVEEHPETFIKLPNGVYTTWPKKPSA